MPVKIEGVKLEKWKEVFLSWAYDKLQPVKTCREFVNANRLILLRLVCVLGLKNSVEIKKLIDEAYPDHEWDSVYDEAVEYAKEALFDELIEGLAWNFKELKVFPEPTILMRSIFPFCIVEWDVFGNGCETCQYAKVVNGGKSCFDSDTPWYKLIDKMDEALCDKYGW